ncbi:MAG: hypothetical protein P4L46_24400 [Fimbriimonas sp.]|nr:hypothetical protein [Fimbriimonas sp.]
MLTILIASLLTGNRALRTGSPIVTSIQGFVVDPIVSISVDGKSEERFGITMTTRHSVVVDKDDAGVSRKLMIGGKTLATAELESPSENVHPVLNALGLTVLNDMAIGIDYSKNQMTFWPGGHLSEKEADAWIMQAPKWLGVSKVWKAHIDRRAGVAPVVSVRVDGKKLDLLLRIGKEGTSFSHGEEPSSGTPVEYGEGGNQAILANMGVGDATLPWILYFRGVSYDPKKSIDSSVLGTFTTENLLARRVIVDLAAGEMYSEQLPPDAQLSMFLTEWLQLPINVEGDRIFLKEMPGTSFFGQLASIYDSEVLEVMGQPAAAILGAARDFTGDHRILLKVLFEKVWKGYKLKIKRPNGQVIEADFDPPK